MIFHRFDLSGESSGITVADESCNINAFSAYCLGSEAVFPGEIAMPYDVTVARKKL